MGMTAADYWEIHQLNSRYCHTVDFGDLDGVVSVFAPDGAFEAGGDPSATRRGERELRRSVGARDGKGHVRHTTLGQMVEGDGTVAKALSPVMITIDWGPPVGRMQVTRSGVVAMGFYDDDLVKHEGRWVYARRTFNGRGGDWATERLGQPVGIAPIDAGPVQAELTPLDYEAIRQLLMRTDYTLDFEDYDGFADCFIGDGSLHELARPEAHPETRLAARGRTELWQYAVSVSGIGFRGHVHRAPLSCVIEGDGRRARVSSYALITQDYGRPAHPRQHGNAAVRMTAMYRDEVVKVAGRWLLAKRTVRKDTFADVAALVQKPLALTLFDEDDRPPADSGGLPRIPEAEASAEAMSAADYEGIQQLFTRYSQTLDFGDSVGFAACFTEDGILDTSEPHDGLAGVHRGADALHAYASTATDYSRGRVRQTTLNFLVDGDGRDARSSSYAIVTRAHSDATNPHGKPSQATHSELLTTAMLFDELVKIDGRWLVARRQLRHDGLPEVMERLRQPVTIGPKANR
jgi:hypothetical protein